MKKDLDLISLYSELNNADNILAQILGKHIDELNDIGLSAILEDVDDDINDIKKFNNESESLMRENINIIQQEIYNNNISEELICEAEEFLKDTLQNIKEDYFELEKYIINRRNKNWTELVRNLKSFSRQFPQSCRTKQLQKIGQLNQIHHQFNNLIKQEIQNHKVYQLLDEFEGNLERAKDLMQRINNKELENYEEDHKNIDNTEDILQSYKGIKEYKNLKNLAIKNGFKYERQKGSHAIYKNKKNKIVVIPDKVGAAPIGTQRSILKSIVTN